MMLSIAQPDQAYQYFLSQGLLFGIGSAMVFTPALAVIGHYFRRNRGIAFGFVASGSSIGGVIFPIIYQRLFPRVGFGWSVRTSAFVCLACLIVSCALLRTRLPLKPTTTREILQFVDLGGFRDARYCCAAASAFLCVLFLHAASHAHSPHLPPSPAPFTPSSSPTFTLSSTPSRRACRPSLLSICCQSSTLPVSALVAPARSLC